MTNESMKTAVLSFYEPIGDVPSRCRGRDDGGENHSHHLGCIPCEIFLPSLVTSETGSSHLLDVYTIWGVPSFVIFCYGFL